MRIDHALVSSTLVDRVIKVEILGHGSQREGFMGSDHCPLLIELRPIDAVATDPSLASTWSMSLKSSDNTNEAPPILSTVDLNAIAIDQQPQPAIT